MNQTITAGQNNAHKWTMLFVVVIMSFMSCLDSSIVNVALPVMTKELAISLSSIVWVVAAYLIAICSTILIFGRLGDMIGKSKVFKIGIILFTVGSLLCGFSTSFLMLVASRVIQGIGASAYMANNQGIITQIFDRTERGKALGILAAAVALGTMIGPPLGGLIVSVLSWKFIFFINVPIGIVTAVLGFEILPKGERTNERLDIPGTILLVITTILLFGAIIRGQDTGFNNLYLLAAITAALVLGALFILLELKQRQPLLDLELFKCKQFSLSLFCAFISFACTSASIILIPFYLEDTLKIAPANAGIFMMLSPLIVAVLSPLSGALSDKIGSEALIFAGLLMMGTGLFLMSSLNEISSLASAGIFVSVLAFGQGLFQPANNSLIMSAPLKNKLGVAGSVNSFVRNFGQIVGVTFSTTLLYGFMSLKLKRHVSDYMKGRDDIFVYGMKNVYLILAIVCCVGVALAAIRMFAKKKGVIYYEK